IGIGKAIWTAGSTPLIGDTDDAMRLTTVRDLLAGQNWWDHIQHRLNAPYGAEIHWSHLVDAAEGGLILLLKPFAGSMAETIALYVWPLLLLLALLVLCGRLAFRLAGREAMLPAVILPITSLALIPEFSPGRIDHHSIQILLMLLTAWSAIESIERPRFAMLAGIAAALQLAIGIEGLAAVIAAILAIALIWVVRPERAAALRGFGITFALGTIAVLINQYPPSRWFEPACDEISIVYTAFAVGVGAVLVLLSVLPLAGRAPWQRLATGGVLAAILAVVLAKAYPLCLAGPYAGLDPWLVTNWLDQISEAKSLAVSLKESLPMTVGVALPPALGLIVIGFRVWRGPTQGRGEWLILGLFLGLSVVVMFAQVRGGRLAMPLALPAAGWLIVIARRRYLSGNKLVGALGLVASWLGFAGIAIGVIAVLVTMPFAGNAAASAPAAPSDAACRMPAAFATLARLPPARVMTPVDLGSHLLAFTPHSAVGAPYQRDQAGVLDTFHFFNHPIGEARQILAARGVTLVVVCPQMPEMRGLPDAAPDSFVKLFAAGKLPDWLTQISAPGDALKVFRAAP
ncbi:MAG: hypothetical protein ABI377_02675, partial [Devosia sp.]